MLKYRCGQRRFHNKNEIIGSFLKLRTEMRRRVSEDEVAGLWVAENLIGYLHT